MLRKFYQICHKKQTKVVSFVNIVADWAKFRIFLIAYAFFSFMHKLFELWNLDLLHLWTSLKVDVSKKQNIQSELILLF